MYYVFRSRRPTCTIAAEEEEEDEKGEKTFTKFSAEEDTSF